MLNQIMIEVAEDAMARRKKADEAYFSQMERNVAAKREKWSARISACLSKNQKMAKSKAKILVVDDVPEWAQIILSEQLRDH